MAFPFKVKCKTFYDATIILKKKKRCQALKSIENGKLKIENFWFRIADTEDSVPPFGIALIQK